MLLQFGKVVLKAPELRLRKDDVTRAFGALMLELRDAQCAGRVVTPGFVHSRKVNSFEALRIQQIVVAPSRDQYLLTFRHVLAHRVLYEPGRVLGKRIPDPGRIVP